MNKKYLSAILFGALLASSMGTFTSCKDYDDDIKGLQEQIDNNGNLVGTIQTQLNTLQAAADAAKKSADEAKAAADAAKGAGDSAKALAEEAKAAVATAKAEAIAQAAQELKAVKESLESAIANKVDTKVYEAKVKELGAAIEGIEEGLSNLGEDVKANAEDIKELQDADLLLQKADKDLQLQLNALKLYAEATRNMAEVNQDSIVLVQGNLEALAQTVDDLKKNMNGELDAIKKNIKTIQDDIKTINEDIKAINADLVSLHTLIVSRLTSIALAPELYVGGVPAVEFSSLIYQPIAIDKENEEPGKEYAYSLGAPAIARYHFNPRSFNLDNAKYAYNGLVAETRSVATANQWIAIEGQEKNVVEGTVDFTVRRLNAHSTMLTGDDIKKANTISLEATLTGKALDKSEKEGDVVVNSEYYSIVDKVLDKDDVRIADKKTLVSGKDDAHYAITFNDCKTEKPRYKVAYDKVFNLKDSVATCYGKDDHTVFPIEDYKLSYKFYVASSKYEISEGQTETDQQKWVVCNDAVEGLFQAEGFNAEAFGRTPILRVDLVDEGGRVVRRGFVKIQFVAEKQPNFTVGNEAADLLFLCSDTKAHYEITEEYIRENVYRKITNGTNVGMSHEEFWNTYDANSATTEMKKDGKAYSISAPKIVDGATGVGTATKKVVWDFTHGELGKIGAGSQFVATVTVKNKLSSSKYPDAISFQFVVNVTLPEFTLAKIVNDVLWEKNAEGEYSFFIVNPTTPDNANSPAEESQIYQDLKKAYSKYTVTNSGEIECTTDAYVLVATYANGEKTDKVLDGVKLNGTQVSLDKADATVKAALNSVGGLQAEVAHIYTLESGDKVTVNTFMLNFTRPVNLNMPSGIEVQDAKTGGDVANFQWNGLLTDWRGEAIIAPFMEIVNVKDSYWVRNCQPEYTWTDGHYEEVAPARLDITTGVVDVVTANDVKGYKGTVTYTYVSLNDPTVTTDRTYSTPYWMLTKNDVSSYLSAEGLKGIPAGYKPSTTTFISYSESTVTAGTHVQYTYPANINYVPAEYKWIEGEFVVVPHEHTEMPTLNGTSEGQEIGCWKWTAFEHPATELHAGQYWNFYGQIGDVTAKVADATTNLTYNGGKLPDNASLVQKGNTVVYKNVESPISYSYEIYVPVSVNYGWGTLNARLTITVKPVQK